MAFYIFKFDYPYFNTWHVVEADTKEDAIKKVLRGTKDIPEHKVKFWRGNGLPKTVAGRYMLPAVWKKDANGRIEEYREKYGVPKRVK